MKGLRDNWVLYTFVLILAFMFISYALLEGNALRKKADVIYVDKQNAMMMNKMVIPLNKLINKVDSIPFKLKK
jgi:hypothetical protein